MRQFHSMRMYGNPYPFVRTTETEPVRQCNRHVGVGKSLRLCKRRAKWRRLMTTGSVVAVLVRAAQARDRTKCLVRQFLCVTVAIYKEEAKK